MERIDIGETTIEMLIEGEGSPLLFLHGIDYFAQQIPFLGRLAQRYRVHAPRHPGFGKSPRPAWMRNVGDLAYLYLDLIEQLYYETDFTGEHRRSDRYSPLTG